MDRPAYSELSKLLRSLFTAARPTSDWMPRDPHCAWQSIRPNVGYTISPEENIVTTGGELHGRFIMLPDRHGFNYNPAIPHVILSLRRPVSRIPPHPGLRPNSYNEFNHPEATYYDGSQGPYEARKYPQEVDMRRPWLPFHDFPQSGSQRPVESWNVAEFFDFSAVERQGFTGGQWSIRDIKALFERRKKVEEYVVGVIQVSTKGIDSFRTSFATSLPFLDELELDHVKSWRSWMDGRDALGRSLRYTAELLALGRWLKEVHRQSSDATSSMKDMSKYMGAWVGGIDSKATWLFMLRAPIPLYGLFAIGPDHPLFESAQKKSEGQSLDADEHFRTDSFTPRLPDVTLHNFAYGQKPRPHTGILYPNAIKVQRESLSPPSGLTCVLPPGDRIVVEDGYISPTLPWTAYLFMDTRIIRHTRDQFSQFHWSQDGKKLQKTWRGVVTSTTFIPPPTIPQGTSPLMKIHPIVAVLPKRMATDRKKRTFREENDGCCFWPVYVGRESAKDHKAFELGNNDYLITDYEWPMLEDIAPPLDPERGGWPPIDTNKPLRVYMRREPTPMQKEKMPQSYFEVEIPEFSRPPVITRLGTTSETKTTRPKPRLCDSDDEDFSLADLFEGSEFTPRSPPFSAQPSHPTLPTFSTTRLSGTLDSGPSNSCPTYVAADSGQSTQGATRALHQHTGNSGGQQPQPGPRQLGQRQETQWQLKPDVAGRHQSSLKRSCSPRSRSPRQTGRTNLRSRRHSPDRVRGRPSTPPTSAPWSPKSLFQARGMSLSPSHPLYLALEEPATRTREDADIKDGPADSKLQRKWTTQTASVTDESDAPLSLAKEQVPTKESSTAALALASAYADVIMTIDDKQPSSAAQDLQSTNLSASPEKDQELAKQLSTAIHEVPSASTDVTMVLNNDGSSPKNDREFADQPSTRELPSASIDVTMVINDEQPSTAVQDLQSTGRPMPFEPAQAPARQPSTAAPGLPTTPQVTTTWHGSDLVQIREGRLRADAYATFRLNLSNAPTADCAQLVAAYLRHSKMGLHVVCYPLRFRNVFLVQESPTDLIGTFLPMVSRFGDVILISLHREADGSSTFDVGFRFADEALCTWQKDGYRHGDHYWRISPVSFIGGHCCIVPPPAIPHRSKMARVDALNQALQLETQIQACSVTDVIAGVVIEQMQQVLRELRTFNYADTTWFTSSGEYATLGTSFSGSFVEIKPRADPSDWTVSPPESSMLYWVRHWQLPRAQVPLPHKQTGSAGRRARKRAQLPAPVPGVDPAAFRLDIPQRSYELHLAFRATHHAASEKHRLWNSPHEGIQFPPVPAMTKLSPDQKRDSQAYMDIWQWYDDCVGLVQSAYTASGLGHSHASPTLTDLPTPSTGLQRRDTVRHLSYNALQTSLSPRERLHALYGEAYLSVMRIIDSS